jgi:hypothetical protein
LGASCAAPFLAHSLVSPLTHPHLHRRRWLEASDSRCLLALSEPCADRSLPRLGELVAEVLFQLWSQLPLVPRDPELEKQVPV